MPDKTTELTVEVFRIKPLKWEWYEERHTRGWRVSTVGFEADVWQWTDLHGEWSSQWRYYTNEVSDTDCASPEEGKQLAEQHWQEWIKQALVPVEE